MPFILTDTSVTIFHDHAVHSATVDNPRFNRIVEALKKYDFNTAVDLINRAPAIANYIATVDYGTLEIRDGTLYWKGEPLHNSLADRIMRMHDEGFGINPMLRFLDNLLMNSSNRAIQELYTFLENGNLPITEDGHFLAYKRIRADYRDCHSGTIDNHPGQVVKMPRRLVDDDARNVCSHGLHFASLDYLKHFTGDRLVVLKIDPADVVSIPLDYNFTKGRTWRYEVLEEIPMPSDFSTWDGCFHSSVWAPVGDEQELDEENEDLTDEDDIGPGYDDKPEDEPVGYNQWEFNWYDTL